MAVDPNLDPAVVYDRHFVPALFRPWAETVAAVAQIAPGQRVLDVACGTGALTGIVHNIVGGEGKVTGLDANDQMLAVARDKYPHVDWLEGRAESLPFADGSFDAVVSQFGFMFFDDQRRALTEIMRVLRPGGHLAVAVCDALDHSPGYAVLAELLHRLFGRKVADAFRAPFCAGDARRLRALCADAGLDQAVVARYEGQVRFASIADLISTERACAWTLGGLLDDVQFARLAEEAEESLRPFAGADGRVAFDMPALIIGGPGR